MSLKAAILPVTPFQQNCTLLWNDETMRGAVSDPGGDLDRILNAALELGVTIEKVLLTHGHLDHASAAGELAAQLDIPIEGPHRDDLFLIEALPKQGKQYGFPEYRGFEPTRWLVDGDTVEVSGLTLDVRHCPGHTPGHVVFFHEPSRLAIVGDVIFNGSVGRTDLPRGDYNALVTSIRDRLWPLGDDVTFVPGHGPLSTFGAERLTNPFVADENFR
ncbi:MAG: MBL fold metallo-hydrolase [Parvibaculum sp.]|jgi:glyoxylase-like metal-dependent hydrolase (beta-lactamase superfamily II)|uniref:MBL fold metallo-hydrolase n=1 Tax=Parvibaculum sp. TaxID=2024848 RepID=UPI002840BAB9|nr:MBL fold metallo-hydrolase [Parvibaculum sp.]MDR3498602.1 MBL fold metallo-hydrolase [Parvibaculum sp.]